MPIQFPVGPGTILLCDYTMGGFRPPEMVKRRPAVVISPRLAHRDGLCAVVPLSGSEPDRPLAYVVRLALQEPLPDPFVQSVWWAKCDHVATVGFARLDLFRTVRDPSGRRRYLHPKLPPDQMREVRAAVLHGLGMGNLAAHLGAGQP